MILFFLFFILVSHYGRLQHVGIFSLISVLSFFSNSFIFLQSLLFNFLATSSICLRLLSLMKFFEPIAPIGDFF
ncbi:hypothetical protein P175DRAFT_0157923 [Aspergillus ochraceoroseus IBT 24754]|uniref:Uncharacterized protein n=1 Tax=Aspergillus ochraceoroseus IBT 24754 TaxID=1392256 RepID=A0A2T5M3J6_9EURO|nr:uncharacterized protein P175DRAFT_0157923 [Aspergillus ochraceoroseus IBT 24754]PTU23104.1 hypothetical protein P175DRAFT_0157923 [Aspergillus ochraceoroseus IBT 24754]